MNNPELDLAFDFVQYTNRNVFLTGKAGTGKTTFLHHLREVSPKRMVVVAPTGVAAINAGGVTIHSFFQLPFGPILPGRLNNRLQSGEENKTFQRFNKRKINIIRSLDLLVIDEISMVRADLLDGIDSVLRRFKDNRKPFGGVQLLMIGDLQQLAPVVKEDEWTLLRQHYDSFYFFSSKAFIESGAVSIELKHVYRQHDSTFINILNEIRDNRLSPASIEILNKRYKPGFSPETEQGYITLTTHNAIAGRINLEQLEKLPAKSFTFKAETEGKFPEYSYPADEFLTLKEGAQVMFIKNDSSPEKRYYNGKIGKITEIEDEVIYVQCAGDEMPIEVGTEKWENVQYTINERSKEIEESVSGTFTQYPLRLAWAITIHKSQGLTFENAVIDANAAFAHGQTYVALSRCKSLEGLVLSTPISPQGIICDPTVGSFNTKVETSQPDEKILHKERNKYMMELFRELFSYRQIEYYIKKAEKIANENQPVIFGNVSENIKLMREKGTSVLNTVAEKFFGQLNYLTSSQGVEQQLQERIKKGAAYFLEQTENHIVKPYQQVSFDTDNRTVKTLLNETLDKISELMLIKKRCFEYCKDGFVMKDYLNVRAVAALEPAEEKKPDRPSYDKTNSDHPILYENLRAWRSRKAQEENLPHYRIISQRAILNISGSLPGNIHQLMKMKGIGKRKIEQYGVDILKIVEEYCQKQDLAVTMALPDLKTSKKDTKAITLELFREGMTIQEIARIRELTEGTIEGHLAFYAGTGDLEIDRFVDPETGKRITGFFRKNPDAGLAEAKGVFGDPVSFFQLRLVRNHMKYLENIAHS